MTEEQAVNERWAKKPADYLFEFEIMKTHTTAGEELLTHAKEELGESGYLNMAVADVFDAL